VKRLVVLLVAAGCVRGEHREARDKYNEGVEALVKVDFEAAEKALLEARSQAGVDPELRFRAAFDLGMAYAAHADKAKGGKDGDLGKALALEQSAASWFADAQRLRKDDDDTRENLAIVRARVQAMSDELRKSEGKLEARLDAVIKEQRGVLDEARDAWLAVKQSGGADPLAQQAALTRLADRERGIVAEAGVIGDLAADEIDAIGKKAEDKRSEDEKVRVVQLKNLDLYLLDGRTKIAEARRKLQDLAAEDGANRAESALAALKRAREQLLDPITVMKEIAQEELALYQETTVSAQAGGEVIVSGDRPAEKAVPAWLAPIAIAGRQNGLHERLEELRGRLAAGVENAGKADNKDTKQPDPQQAKFLERIKAALPPLSDASSAMDRAHQALVGHRMKPAQEAEGEALLALTKAIEQFADLKQTIELAWQHHKELLALLSPEAAKELPATERGQRTRDTLAGNLARMTRLKELIADQLAELDKQPPPQDPKQAEAAKQRLEQAKQQFQQAETLRGQAETALGQLDKAINDAKDPMAPAKEAEAKLDELRKLFFSIIEHLQELIRDQGETRDQTSAANADDDFTRAPKLPGLVTRQTDHGTMAKAITDALAKQADAAAKQPPQQGQQVDPMHDPKALSGAADEMRQAQTEMGGALATLTKARDAKASSESLKPSVEGQGKALEHLESALKLLQPPKQNKQDDKQDQKQDKQEQQPQPQGGAGQRARDDDARRQRERRERESKTDPVDKDW
jgi:hypothetical protein